MNNLFSKTRNLNKQLKRNCLLFCFFILATQSVLAAPLDDFVIIINTTNPGSIATQFTIPTMGAGYNYNVDCNDDGIDEFTAQTGSVVCDYGLLGAGTYTIRIKDNTALGTGFPRIYFNNEGDKDKIIGISQWGTGKWTSMADAFYGCANLNEFSGPVPVFPPDLSNVTDMSWMFAEATTFDITVNNWITTNVTNMSYMFYKASSFNRNMTDWDTTNVTTMAGMFAEASAFNQSIGLWNTAKVIDMSYMFDTASVFNQFTGGWNTANVTDMSFMFSNADAFNQNIGGWDTGSVTSMKSMFYSDPVFNQNIGNWDTSKVTDMSGMFWNAITFNKYIGNWDTSSVTDMSSLFSGAHVYFAPIGNWDTSKVTNMSFMFWDARAFNEPIGNWDTSNVTNMNSMFKFAANFNRPIDSWNTKAVTSMNAMFHSANDYNQSVGNWNIAAVTDMAGMFNGVSLSTTNYDSLLIGWDAQVLKPGVTFDGGNSAYCLGEDAWDNMDINDSWTITDGGINCPASCEVNLAKGSQTGSVAVEACDQLLVNSTFRGESTSTVILSAGTGITFYPGFTVDQGSVLQAKVCGQSLCEASSQPMEYGCHSCVTQICDVDDFCCDTAFDDACQNEVRFTCGLICEGG